MKGIILENKHSNTYNVYTLHITMLLNWQD